MKAIRQGFIGIVAVMVLTVSLPNIGKGEERQLTPQEVSNTFIGTPWHGTVGAFLFKENGTYTYKRFDRKSPLGVWSYKMNKDGSLTGGRCHVNSVDSLV